MNVPSTWKGEPLRLSMSGTPIPMWMGRRGSPPVMLYNFDQNNIVYAGYTSNIAIGGPNTQILPPGFGLTMDGNRTIWVIGIKGAGPIQATPGGGAPFQLSNVQIAALPGVTPSIDASTPAAVNGHGVTTITTASFNPPANSWLVAIMNINDAINAPSTFVDDTGNHTWSNVIFQNVIIGGVSTVVSISRAFVSTAGAITVTLHNQNASASSDIQLSVQVVNNANANQNSAASNTNQGGAANISGVITISKLGSLVFIAGIAVGPNATTPLSGTTTIQDFDDAGLATCLSGKSTANTQATGNTTYGWNANGGTGFNWGAVEVIP